MSTISKTETPTGQEETAILLEEQARRIATLQESLKQACHNPHSNDRVVMQEVDRLVKERDDFKRRLENAEMLIEKLKGLTDRVERAEAVKESLTSALRDIKKNVDDWNLQDYVTIRRLVNAAIQTAEESSVVGLIDSTHAKQSPNAANADGDGDSVIDEEGGGMTRLEWVLKNREDSLEIRNRIVTKFCPSDYGLMNIYCTDSSCCGDCWNQEVEE